MFWGAVVVLVKSSDTLKKVMFTRFLHSFNSQRIQHRAFGQWEKDKQNTYVPESSFPGSSNIDGSR